MLNKSLINETFKRLLKPSFFIKSANGRWNEPYALFLLIHVKWTLVGGISAQPAGEGGCTESTTRDDETPDDAVSTPSSTETSIAAAGISWIGGKEIRGQKEQQMQRRDHECSCLSSANTSTREIRGQTKQ